MTTPKELIEIKTAFEKIINWFENFDHITKALIVLKNIYHGV